MIRGAPSSPPPTGQRVTPLLMMLALLLSAVVPAPSRAATTSTTFPVTSTVLSTCSVAAASLAFGNYTLGQLDATSSVSVTCTFGTNYNVGLDAGTGSGATVITRRMTGPSSQTLDYSLYQDASRSTVWGNTVGSSTFAGTGSGTLQSLTVYGRVTASQTSGVGLYSDTVTVTVTY